MDPTQMSDEELDKAISGEQPEEPVKEEGAPVASPKKEEPAKEEPKPEEEKPKEALEEEPAPSAPPAEEERPPSRREQLRVQQLLKKYGSPSQAPSTPAPQNRPNFREKVTADEDVYKTLEETTEQYGQSRYAEALAQSDYRTWERFLKIDDAQVRAKYPELDGANKEKFHPALADALNVKYLRFVGYNPGDPQRGIPPSVQSSDISYAEFVEAEMEFADEIASQRVAASTQNIARQAANAGLRPDGSSAKPMNLNKAPEDMSDEELNAAISATLPRDSRGRFTSQR